MTTAPPPPLNPRRFLGSPYTETPSGLCFSCRHLATNAHCYGTGDMMPEGFFLGLRCTCDCRDAPAHERVYLLP